MSLLFSLQKNVYPRGKVGTLYTCSPKTTVDFDPDKSDRVAEVYEIRRELTVRLWRCFSVK